MKKLLIVAALLATTPAYAKDITITLNDQEQKVFLSLLDVALKQGGIANLEVVAKFIKKYRDAVGVTTPAPTATPVPTTTIKPPAAPGEKK